MAASERQFTPETERKIERKDIVQVLTVTLAEPSALFDGLEPLDLQRLALTRSFFVEQQEDPQYPGKITLPNIDFNSSYEPAPLAARRALDEKVGIPVAAIVRSVADPLPQAPYAHDPTIPALATHRFSNLQESGKTKVHQQLHVARITPAYRPDTYNPEDNVASVIEADMYDVQQLFSEGGLDTPAGHRLLDDSLSLHSSATTKIRPGEVKQVQEGIREQASIFERDIMYQTIERFIEHIDISGPAIMQKKTRENYRANLQAIAQHTSSWTSEAQLSALHQVLVQMRNENYGENPKNGVERAFREKLRTAYEEVYFAESLPFFPESIGPQRSFITAHILARLETWTPYEMQLLEQHDKDLFMILKTAGEGFGVDNPTTDPQWFRNVQQTMVNDRDQLKDHELREVVSSYFLEAFGLNTPGRWGTLAREASGFRQYISTALAHKVDAQTLASLSAQPLIDDVTPLAELFCLAFKVNNYNTGEVVEAGTRAKAIQKLLTGIYLDREERDSGVAIQEGIYSVRDALVRVVKDTGIAYPVRDTTLHETTLRAISPQLEDILEPQRVYYSGRDKGRYATLRKWLSESGAKRKEVIADRFGLYILFDSEQVIPRLENDATFDQLVERLEAQGFTQDVHSMSEIAMIQFFSNFFATIAEDSPNFMLSRIRTGPQTSDIIPTALEHIGLKPDRHMDTTPMTQSKASQIDKINWIKMVIERKKGRRKVEFQAYANLMAWVQKRADEERYGFDRLLEPDEPEVYPIGDALFFGADARREINRSQYRLKK